jgi:hypothetical protein
VCYSTVKYFLVFFGPRKKQKKHHAAPYVEKREKRGALVILEEY